MKKVSIDILLALTAIFYANLEFYVTREYIESYILNQVQLITLDMVKNKEANAIPYNKARQGNIPTIKI